MIMDRPSNNGPRRISIFPILLIAFLVIVLLLTFINTGDSKKEISINTFYEYLGTAESPVEEQKVAGVYFYGSTVYGVLKGETEEETAKKLENFPKEYDFYITVAYSFQIQEIQERVQAVSNDIVIKSEPVSEPILSQILPYIYILMLIVLGYFVYKAMTKMSGRNGEFGRSKARMDSGLKVRFSDVAGCDEEKQEMQEIVEFLKNPRKFTEMGARIPKGVMLVGPPGTGKTLLAKAIAGEAGVPFFSITGSDFVEMYVGVGAARVRDLFETAKRSSPCLIFIDEIDAVGRQRGAGLGNTNDEREQTLNQLLVQMDGFESSAGIVVIAATNRPDVLDPALLRAGRFDRRIVVNVPDLDGRIKILKLYAKNKPFADDIDWEGIARRLPSTTGADLENILNEAAILAVRDGRNIITESDIFEGSLKVEYGPQKKNRKQSDEEKKITAYHESGHAVVIKTLHGDDKEVQEVTIIPRGVSGGMTSQVDRKHGGDTYQLTRDEMMKHITGLMGGRAAERLIFGQLATGPSNDIEVATNIARDMVTKYGMSEKLGPVCYADGGEVFLGRDFQQRSNISDDTARLIDEEIKSIIVDCEHRAIEVLKQNRSILDEMAKTLIEKQTIYSEEVDELMSGKSSTEVIEAMDKRAEERKQRDAEALARKKKLEEERIANSANVMNDLERTAFKAYTGAQSSPAQKTDIGNEANTDTQPKINKDEQNNATDAKATQDSTSQEEVNDKTDATEQQNNADAKIAKSKAKTKKEEK